MRPLSDLAGLLQPLGPDAGIVLHSGAATPSVLAQRLADAAPALPGRRVYTLMPMGPAPYASAAACEQLDLATFLPGSALRAAMDAGRVRALRNPLSALPGLFARGELRADAVLLRVSPPDADGQVSLGVSVDYMHAALAQARCVVAEIDPRMPRTCGDSCIAATCIDAFVDADDGPYTVEPVPADEVDERIARHVASLVREGDVLQLGVGSLPDRVLAQLGHLKHLGLHTGIIGDAVQPLIESGVIDNSSKTVLPGVSVTTMALGSAGFYRFLDRNPAFELHPCSFTHSRATLAAVGALCAINSALQVDLEGRVNAERIGERRVSLPGGLPDFARAAAGSPLGRSIIALRSAGRSGSNIVARLPFEHPASLEPDMVDFVVTEHGVAALRGATPKQRRRALLAVASPGYRDALAARG